jgi:membrane glycosyltransferase
MAKTFWLFVIFDTDGEVICAAASTLTHQVFNGVPHMNRVYFRLRHQYQKRRRPRKL